MIKRVLNATHQFLFPFPLFSIPTTTGAYLPWRLGLFLLSLPTPLGSTIRSLPSTPCLFKKCNMTFFVWISFSNQKLSCKRNLEAITILGRANFQVFDSEWAASSVRGEARVDKGTESSQSIGLGQTHTPQETNGAHAWERNPPFQWPSLGSPKKAYCSRILPP